MANLINVIRKPIIWVYISVIYIWFYFISKFIASVGPPFIVAKIADTDNSISFSEFKKAFLTYAQKGSEEVGINTQYVLSYIPRVWSS